MILYAKKTDNNKKKLIQPTLSKVLTFIKIKRCSKDGKPFESSSVNYDVNKITKEITAIDFSSGKTIYKVDPKDVRETKGFECVEDYYDQKEQKRKKRKVLLEKRDIIKLQPVQNRNRFTIVQKMPDGSSRILEDGIEIYESSYL